MDCLCIFFYSQAMLEFDFYSSANFKMVMVFSKLAAIYLHIKQQVVVQVHTVKRGLLECTQKQQKVVLPTHHRQLSVQLDHCLV